MSGYLPIIPGCRCIVVGAVVPESNGREVRAIRLLGSSNPWAFKLGLNLSYANDWWEIDTKLPVINLGTRQYKGSFPFVREANLLRIDGEWEGKEEEIFHIEPDLSPLKIMVDRGKEG